MNSLSIKKISNGWIVSSIKKDIFCNSFDNVIEESAKLFDHSVYKKARKIVSEWIPVEYAFPRIPCEVIVLKIRGLEEMQEESLYENGFFTAEEKEGWKIVYWSPKVKKGV